MKPSTSTSPRSFPTLRHSNTALTIRQDKPSTPSSLQSQRDRYYELSIRLKEENEKLILTNKELGVSEEKLRKRMDEIRRKVEEEERKERCGVEEESEIDQMEKENNHMLGNYHSELDYLKSMLKRAQEEDEEKLNYLEETVELKERELEFLRKQLVNLN